MSEETVPAATVAETEMATAGAAARGRTSLREYAESLLVTVLLAIFGTTFVVADPDGNLIRVAPID